MNEPNRPPYQPTAPFDVEPEPPEPNQVALALREPVVYLVRRTGRNSPCRCGSGVKFKVCCRRKVVRV